MNMGGQADRSQSGLMPANLITLAHFSVSPAITVANSAGDNASALPPRSVSLACIFGSARPKLTSLLSFSTISAGVHQGRQRQDFDNPSVRRAKSTRASVPLLWEPGQFSNGLLGCREEIR